ncbi:hypothetical protein [Bacillus sp. COPE52]|uniref:hypothetical protein n=1 Tax=Bacillus sp. COPE52 TaxID=2233998 RepID=UPI000E106C9B|nr:hypothetical protein [Bacillus sp. COPE52]AXK19127.1 hypothetical protein DPQ31_16080 [Bacillus sp. COPE52]
MTRIKRLLQKFGKQSDLLRRTPKDKNSPFDDKGEFTEITSFVAIVDEDTQGGKSAFSRDRVGQQVDAMLYCNIVDIRVGDKVVQRGKEYKVMKVSNPYNSDDHLECVLEHYS